MGPRGSLHFWRESVTSPFREPDWSTPHCTDSCFFTTHFNIFCHYARGFSVASFLPYSPQNIVCISIHCHMSHPYHSLPLQPVGHILCPSVTQYTLHLMLNFTTGNSFCWPTLVEFINYTPWRWPSKGCHVLEFSKVFIKWWFSNTWLHLSAIIRHSDINARMWSR